MGAGKGNNKRVNRVIHQTVTPGDVGREELAAFYPNAKWRLLTPWNSGRIVLKNKLKTFYGENSLSEYYLGKSSKMDDELISYILTEFLRDVIENKIFGLLNRTEKGISAVLEPDDINTQSLTYLNTLTVNAKYTDPNYKITVDYYDHKIEFEYEIKPGELRNVQKSFKQPITSHQLQVSSQKKGTQFPYEVVNRAFILMHQSTPK